MRFFRQQGQGSRGNVVSSKHTAFPARPLQPTARHAASTNNQVVVINSHYSAFGRSRRTFPGSVSSLVTPTVLHLCHLCVCIHCDERTDCAWHNELNRTRKRTLIRSQGDSLLFSLYYFPSVQTAFKRCCLHTRCKRILFTH